MTFSTRNNPRLAQGTAITSLGAVGGPRGVAAGGLRVLVEFITSYDPSALKQVEADLQALDAQEQVASQASIARQQQIAKIEERIYKATHVAKAELDNDALKALKKYQLVQQGGTKAQIQLARQELEAKLTGAVNTNKITKTQASEILKLGYLQRKKNKLLGDEANAHEQIAQIIDEKTTKERLYQQLAGTVPRLGARIAGLAIGAIGGIVGGAILGVGFQLAQAALEKLGESIQDMIDPARHAREALDELGSSIGEIAKSEGLTFFEATAKYFEDLGVEVDAATLSLLAEAAAWDQVREQVEAEAKAEEAARYSSESERLAIEAKVKALIAADKATGNYHRKSVTLGGVLRRVTDYAYYEAKAIEELTGKVATLEEFTKRLTEAKKAQAEADRILAIRAQALSAILTAAAARYIAPLQAQLTGLENAEPSARTKSLEAQIEALQGAGGGGGAQTAQLREERALLLLRQRLLLMKEEIDLSRYSGKFLLEAINAKIAALDKEARAQEKLNALQDLAYKESQIIRRSEGESISDFLQRRAQENRGLLQERANLERQAKIESLNELKEKTQIEVDLAENAEAIKTAAVSAGTSARLKALQKELKASQKADEEALKAKKKALEEQIAAREKARDEAIEVASDEAKAEVRIMVEAGVRWENVYKASSRLQALIRAKNIIETLSDAFGMPKWYAKELLVSIESQIALLRGWLGRSIPTVGGGPLKLQQGGVFPLNNASTVFGSNIRTGESGTELGVILSNKVTQALRESQGGATFGNIYINRSQDELRDRWMIKKVVREAMQEALG